MELAALTSNCTTRTQVMVEATYQDKALKSRPSNLTLTTGGINTIAKLLNSSNSSNSKQTSSKAIKEGVEPGAISNTVSPRESAQTRRTIPRRGTSSGDRREETGVNRRDMAE
jgi:hypothetical protein